MNIFKRTWSIWAAILLFFATSCNEKESTIGIELQDPFTLYNGICDTAYMQACTIFDDSLKTSGYSAGIIGRHYDDCYGGVEATLYTQLALSNSTGIDFEMDSLHLDSVILNIMLEEWYPNNDDSTSTYNIHLTVKQLAEPVVDTMTYYAFDELDVDNSTNACLYDNTLTCTRQDSIRIHLNPENFKRIIGGRFTTQEFMNHSKGLQIRMQDDSDPVMLTVNFAASNTKITAYYTYGQSATQRTMDFIIGNTATISANHFSNFTHDYPSQFAQLAQNQVDSIEGSQYLYIEPLGGTNIKLDLNEWITEFNELHPTAVIHHAELILPLADIADNNPPDQILANRKSSSGYIAYIQDLLSSFTSHVYDGKYHEDKGQYRMCITQHLQQLLRTGKDYGTILVINARRSSAKRTVINGTDPSKTIGLKDNSPIRIEFIYTDVTIESN